MKKLIAILSFLALSSGCISFSATINRDLVSSNSFVAGTNGIYQASLANLTTASNALASSSGGNLAAATNAINTYIPTNNWTTLQPLAIQTGSSTVSNSFSVGGGTAITKILTGTATLDFPSTATNAISTLTITVNGAGTNGCAFLNIVSPDAAFIYGCTIESTNTVTVRAANISTGAVDPAATSARVVVFQY